MQTRPATQKLFLGIIGILAFAPAVATFALRDYFLDTNAIGRTTFSLQQIEIDHRKINSLLYKVQGFGEVEAREIKANSAGLISACHEAASAEWYSHDRGYAKLKAVVEQYCEITERRSQLIDAYDSETKKLVADMATFPKSVKDFHNDQRELEVEDLERLVMAYAVRPTPDVEAEIRDQLSTFKAERYKAYRASAESVLSHANKRASLIASLTDHAPLALLQKAKELHFGAVVEHDIGSTLARQLLTYLSLLFAAVILVTYYNLQTTSRKLKILNRTLETQVEARTKELQEAMNQLAEQQSMLAQKTKMSALGEMAGGIAHEINTPLAAISLHAELLAGDISTMPKEKIVEGLNSITGIVERISRIVQGLKRFARADETTPRTSVPVSQILDDTLLLCAEKLKARGVKLLIETNGANPELDCVPEQISQVLINLLNNSLDAVEELPQKRKWIRVETHDHDGVFKMAVSDGGDSIPESVREKLMQPFFTTKQIGKGTGLGLSISKGIMLSHQGTLEFDASKKETTFVMTMPSRPNSNREQETHDFAIAR